MAGFEIKTVLARAWELMRGRFWFLVLLFVCIGIVMMLLSFIEQGLQENVAPLGFIVSLISAILNVVLGMGLIRVMLQIVKGNPGAVSDLWEPLPHFFGFLGASILYGVMVMIGGLLLVVPGIIVMIRFQFFGYLIIDQKLGAIEALKKSFEITRGNGWHLLGFGFVLTAINFLGVLLLIIGLFVSIPFTSLAGAVLYLTLAHSAGENSQQAAA